MGSEWSDATSSSRISDDPEMRFDGLWSDGRIVVVGEEADPPDVEKVRVFDLTTGRDRPLELPGEG